MIGLPKDNRVNCEWFLDQLEALPKEGRPALEVWLTKLPNDARAHAAACPNCEAALQDFLDTRLALEGMQAISPGPGPWFTARVMQAIASQERENEETLEGFWVGVRRLAPRLVAFAMLLLMLGGTWAFEENRTARENSSQALSVEGIFQGAPSTPVNDDVVAISLAEKP
jgi:hypothetical protein